MKRVRVLSLDGGGMRGLIPATVMEYVENKLIEKTKNKNARIADYFDIIVGTSTGGILSCFYLTPNPNKEKDTPSAKYTASQALEFYSQKGYSIFNKSKHKSWFGLRQLINSTQYKPQVIEEIFKEEFKDLKLTDLLKQCLVTTYNIENKSSFFFSNKENETKKFLYSRYSSFNFCCSNLLSSYTDYKSCYKTRNGKYRWRCFCK
jgi:patatin-like phospholipase/acyl hydrolase